MLGTLTQGGRRVGMMNKLMNFLGLQEEEEVVTRDRIVEDDEVLDMHTAEQKRKGNVVSIHSQKQTRLILSEPRTYDEAQELADHLRNRKPIIVNLQRVRSDQAGKIVDFLSGTVYALNGSIAKLGPDIFVCTPDHIEIQGTITEMLQDEPENRMQR